MTPRRLATTAVVLATVGAGTAFTISANAGTARDPGAAVTTDTPSVSPEMRAALRRDLSLTDAQLDARLRREAWAAQTASALRQSLGDGYAGAWLTGGGQQLTVAVTDRALTNQVRAAGARAAVVARSASELTTVKRALDRRAGAASTAVTGWYVDVATNTVVVRAAPARMSAARSFVRSTGVDTDAVRLVASDTTPRLLYRPKPTPSYSPPSHETPPPYETAPRRRPSPGGD
ncbi:hypothetical protein Prum_021030 [Phytohabitans rumicis]|uniref:Peptidase S1A alpha-lytic prodomain domain-containing protein n=2 Tax=Phytohabitans rumicis TaxID=1076125 RepID=A0A6V8L0Y3_9ACTN|nr:hypothetical protein Prum_021030 [Phytohabitans rumicis]